MAITRAQQVRQMLEDGGMLVQPSMTGKRPGYRGDAAYGDKDKKGQTKDTKAAGDGPASAGFDQDAKPGKQSPEVYGASGKQYDPEVALAAAKAQGYFDKKNPIENFLDDYTKNTRKFLYNTFPNRPTNELDYLKSLPTSQRALLSPSLRAKLEALELDEDQDLLDTANTKFTFDEFEELRKFQPTEGLNFAEYAAKFKGAPGLLYSGDVGNLIKTKNPDGTFSYRRDFSQDDKPMQMANKITTDPTDPTDPNQTTDVFAGIAPRFAGSIFDFDALRRQLEEEQSAADGGRIGAMEGGIMDLETARQAMFLGGIVKGLKKITKKATRAVKKVVKSPIGKAAILGGLGYLGFQGIGGKTGLSKFLFKEAGKGLSFGELLKGGMTGKGMLALGGGLTLAPFLFGKPEEEDDPDPNRGPKLTMEELLAIRGAPFNTLAPRFTGSTFAAEGGRMGYQEGSKEPVAKKVMPLLDMGGKEMDLRDNGGFVPIGRMEKADDVPARLSKNEFVFTAEAVRNAGDGDVDKGSEVMYNMMKNLEDGGNVSEESQGLEGARDMFQTAQRLQEVI